MNAPERYNPPDPGEVRIILASLGLSTRAAAADCCMDDRRVRRWQVQRDSGGVNMPFTCLYYLLRKYRGVEVSPATWRADVKAAGCV